VGPSAAERDNGEERFSAGVELRIIRELRMVSPYLSLPRRE